jgi:hypothetical protein
VTAELGPTAFHEVAQSAAELPAQRWRLRGEKFLKRGRQVDDRRPLILALFAEHASDAQSPGRFASFGAFVRHPA